MGRHGERAVKQGQGKASSDIRRPAWRQYSKRDETKACEEDGGLRPGEGKTFGVSIQLNPEIDTPFHFYLPAA